MSEFNTHAMGAEKKSTASCNHCEAIGNQSTVKSKSESIVHPCEPLSPQEILVGVEIIKAHAVYSATNTRIVSITLEEPFKKLVMESNLTSEVHLDREAHVVLLDNR